jgi:hypothetical protein
MHPKTPSTQPGPLALDVRADPIDRAGTRAREGVLSGLWRGLLGAARGRARSAPSNAMAEDRREPYLIR